MRQLLLRVVFITAAEFVFSRMGFENVMERKIYLDNLSPKDENYVIETTINISIITCVMACMSLYPKCTSVLFQATDHYCKPLRMKLTIENAFYDPGLTAGLINFQYSCLPGWNEFRGECYRLFTTKMKWMDAKSECQSHNSHLVEVTSTEENLYVTENFIKPAEQCTPKWDCAVWMGGRMDIYHGNFVWTHTGMPLNFTNWDLYQPSGGSQDCTSIWARGYWDDSTCGEALEFICEKTLP